MAVLARLEDIYGVPIWVNCNAIEFIGPAKSELNKGEPCTTIIICGDQYVVKGMAAKIVWDLGFTEIIAPRTVKVTSKEINENAGLDSPSNVKVIGN